MIIRITPDNKAYFTRRYVDYLLSHMDNTDIFDALKHYLFQEKFAYPIDRLELEITRYCPEILKDHLAELAVGKEKEYASSIH